MTSDGDALFRAVCENPADDTPRLVYADWLEENGHPERAEFVRLQCEAWNLCPDYPTEAARRTRASELLRAFGDEWYDDLPVLPGVEWSDLFVRGFVDAAWVVAARNIVAQVAPVMAATPLRHLTLGGTALSQLEAFLQRDVVGRLASLTVLLPGPSDAVQMLLAEAGRRFPAANLRAVRVWRI